MFRVTSSVEKGAAEFNSSWVDVRLPSTSQIQKCLGVNCMVLVYYFLWRNSLGFCSNCNWCTVFVRTRNHQDTISSRSLKSSLNVGWKVTACYVTQMQWTIGIWPSNANEDMLSRHRCHLTCRMQRTT